jgi:hypothetical protein
MLYFDAITKGKDVIVVAESIRRCVPVASLVKTEKFGSPDFSVP